MNIFISAIECHYNVKLNSLAMNLQTVKPQITQFEVLKFISHVTDYASSLFYYRNEIDDVET